MLEPNLDAVPTGSLPVIFTVPIVNGLNHIPVMEDIIIICPAPRQPVGPCTGPGPDPLLLPAQPVSPAPVPVPVPVPVVPVPVPVLVPVPVPVLVPVPVPVPKTYKS